MNRSVAQYRRAFKKQLACSRSTQEQLTLRFQSMLNGFLEDYPSPTMQELYNALGSPEELAKSFSADIPAEEAVRYARKQTARRVIVGILVGLLLIATVYVFFVKQSPLISYDEGIVYSSEEHMP